MPPYPIFLDLAGAACVVVGGGEVAERRTAALLDVGARVSVVAPRATLALRAWATEGRIRLASREIFLDMNLAIVSVAWLLLVAAVMVFRRA